MISFDRIVKLNFYFYIFGNRAISFNTYMNKLVVQLHNQMLAVILSSIYQVL